MRFWPFGRDTHHLEPALPRPVPTPVTPVFTPAFTVGQECEFCGKRHTSVGAFKRCRREVRRDIEQIESAMPTPTPDEVSAAEGSE